MSSEKQQLKIQKNRHTKQFRGVSVGQWGLLWFALSLLCLILRNAPLAADCMRRALTLCARTVIPSLFPFLVLSGMLAESGCGELLGKLAEKPCRLLFGLGGNSACALLMGLICGFPVGTKVAVSLYRRGLLDESALSRLICLCNVPSPAFLIGAVGTSLMGNRSVGLWLYAACLLSVLVTALFGRRSFPQTPIAAETTPAHERCSLTTVLTRSVASASTSMLYICAYVAFFSVLSGILGQIFAAFTHTDTVGGTIGALIAGFLELSGGVSLAASLPNRTCALLLIAFFCGWSGMSVHMQILSLCDGIHIRIRQYFLSKLLQGGLVAAFLAPVLHFMPHLLPASTSSCPTAPTALLALPSLTSSLSLPVNILFGLCLIGTAAVLLRGRQHP